MSKEIYKFECTRSLKNHAESSCRHLSIINKGYYCDNKGYYCDNKEETSSCSYKEILYNHGCSIDHNTSSCQHLRYLTSAITENNPEGKVCVAKDIYDCNNRFVIREELLPELEPIKRESENAINELEL